MDSQRTIIANNKCKKFYFDVGRFNNNVENNDEQCTYESNVFLIADALKPFYIDVSNSSDGSSVQQCAHNSAQFAPSETRVFPCPCGIYGRYVRIRYPLEQSAYIVLCEVQIQSGGEYNQ